jgi:putative FmdB family regulatory protein
MPIFEYECRDCSTSFELLVRSGTRIACPSCQSRRVLKKLSLFAAHTRKPEAALPACHTGGQGCNLGKCGSGFCGIE